ncbi:apoptosis regulatory protein Siva [Puntigrus tetrazona]|uniref:apoptosis regulatory protein Siva n=1 Tax=Puntigrus tetrazona TaxID=1606681 RepID=UPI001C8A4DFA|nr:apoptosis regulatory protein Siva [Puntigrus tetrazona]
MPKRSCPFSESFSSQYKVHVGQKEINRGVFGLKYRQEVYEKTKNLLFNGTKAVMGRLWKADGSEKASDEPVSDQTAEPAAPGPQTLLKGQTRIGLDGRLQRAAAAAAGGAAAPPVCCVCQRLSGSRGPCSRCERHACAPCIQQCTVCSDRCCSFCSVTDYSERYERVLCCDCSS